VFVACQYNVDDACMFAWRSTRSESQRHYSQVGVSSERREPNGVGRSRLAGWLAVSCVVAACSRRSAGACVQGRKTGQEGPVRGKSGDCPCWRGCAVVDGASEMSRVVVCLSVCLSASEAYLWSSVGERDKHGGTSTTSHEPTQHNREHGPIPTLSPLTG
jgi:hypothetical protein